MSLFELQQLQIEKNLSQMFEIELNDVGTYEENTIYSHFVFLDGRKYEVLVFKYNDHFYCTSAKNPYDLEICLRDGILIRNKLMCPLTGSAWNIENGDIEYGPCMDNLAIFQVRENQKGKLSCFVPNNPPLYTRPLLYPRDYADLRKVIIVGGGAAGYNCAETLRKCSYTGEITVFDDKTEVPYDKTKLRKSVKNYDNRDFELREEEWIDDYSINYMYGTTVESFHTIEKNHYLKTKDEEFDYQYDALCLASGSKIAAKKLYRSEGKKNIMYFNQPKNHRQLKKILNTDIKKLIIMGITLESLELAATIRTEYPRVKIEFIDCNVKSYVKTVYGKEINNALLSYYKNRGIDFKVGTGYASFQEDPDNNKLAKAIKTKDGKYHEADAFVMFPNLHIANTEFIEKADVFEDSKATSDGKICADADATLANKVLFGAGSSIAHTFNVSRKKYEFYSHLREAVNTGKLAAHNILGMGLPLYTIPLSYTKHFTKGFQYVGSPTLYDKVEIVGDLENLDFTAFYIKEGIVIGAQVSESQKNVANIIMEGMRYSLIHSYKEIADRLITWPKLTKLMQENDKYRCFNSEIFKYRFEPIPQLILWREREKMGDSFGEDYEQIRFDSDPLEENSVNHRTVG